MQENEATQLLKKKNLKNLKTVKYEKNCVQKQNLNFEKQRN